jgi:hypothetical protein
MRQSAERVLIGGEGINHCRNRDANLNNAREMLEHGSWARDLSVRKMEAYFKIYQTRTDT